MIQANLKSRLTAKDLSAVSSIVYKSNINEMSLKMFENGLDSPKLYDYVSGQNTEYNLSAPLVFYVMARHFLIEQDVEDREVAEYISSLLLEFGENNRFQKVAKYDDQQYFYLSDLYEDMEHDTTSRKYFCAVHLGNLGIWLGGLFPEHIPNIEYVDKMGRLGFNIASVHPMAQTTGLFSIFDKLVNTYKNVRQSLTDFAQNTHLVS